MPKAKFESQIRPLKLKEHGEPFLKALKEAYGLPKGSPLLIEVSKDGVYLTIGRLSKVGVPLKPYLRYGIQFDRDAGFQPKMKVVLETPLGEGDVLPEKVVDMTETACLAILMSALPDLVGGDLNESGMFAEHSGNGDGAASEGCDGSEAPISDL